MCTLHPPKSESLRAFHFMYRIVHIPLTEEEVSGILQCVSQLAVGKLAAASSSRLVSVEIVNCTVPDQEAYELLAAVCMRR